MKDWMRPIGHPEPPGLSDPSIEVQAHKSVDVFSFLQFSRRSKRLEYFCSCLVHCALSVPPSSASFLARSNLSSLHSESWTLLSWCNTHRHVVHCPHMVLSLESNRKAEGQKPNYCRINWAHGTFRFPLVSNAKAFPWDTRLHSLFNRVICPTFPLLNALSPLHSFISVTTQAAFLTLSTHYCHTCLLR